MVSFALLKKGDVNASLPRGPAPVVGIDLGTTNSTIAEIVWEPGRESAPAVRCLDIDQETTEGHYTHLLVASIVAVHNGKVFVGDGATRGIGGSCSAPVGR